MDLQLLTMLSGHWISCSLIKLWKNIVEFLDSSSRLSKNKHLIVNLWRCIQTELHQVWLSLIKKNRRHEYDRVYLKMLHLRNQMSFFIDNLWSYFHVDVISVQWTKLEEALLQAKGWLN
jgi:Spc97 / Spc98 family.